MSTRSRFTAVESPTRATDRQAVSVTGGSVVGVVVVVVVLVVGGVVVVAGTELVDSTASAAPIGTCTDWLA